MPHGESKPIGTRNGQAGFTYLWALSAVAVLAIGLAAIGPLWARDGQREREQELLRVGALYAQAILSYQLATPGGLKQEPRNLEDLLVDERLLILRRHLRRLYPDPLDPQRPWGLVRGPDQGILGIYSQSGDAPLKQGPLTIELPSPSATLSLPAAQHYSEWTFVPILMAPTR